MPKVRLAGTVHGERDPHREIRARLLYHLFSRGWDIYNSNGDQRITLCNIERKIVESDAFVFTPGATLEDHFKAVSIFVGYQTLDRHLSGKATVLLNTDNSWNDFLSLLDHLNRMGTVLQNHGDYLLPADGAQEVLHLLDRSRHHGTPVVKTVEPGGLAMETRDEPPPDGLNGNVCVFCSASIRAPEYLLEGWEFGRQLARGGFGCVSGAGKSGIMGEVVRGAAEAGGWTGGSNVPHIIELEGLPDGLTSFWLRPDIYTRMEVMIERSDAFVIFPGGTGTVQEMLALMIFKQQGHPSSDKPVVVYNRRDVSGDGFWEPLIRMLGSWCHDEDFTVVDQFDRLLPTVERMMESKRATAGTC